jgi:hypothetical protein
MDACLFHGSSHRLPHSPSGRHLGMQHCVLKLALGQGLGLREDLEVLGRKDRSAPGHMVSAFWLAEMGVGVVSHAG